MSKCKPSLDGNKITHIQVKTKVVQQQVTAQRNMLGQKLPDNQGKETPATAK